MKQVGSKKINNKARLFLGRDFFLYLWDIKPRDSESRMPCFYIFGTLSSGAFVWERGMETENLLLRSLCTDHRDKEYSANTEDTKYQMASNTNPFKCSS